MARLTAFLTDLDLLRPEKKQMIESLIKHNGKGLTVASFTTDTREKVYINKVEDLENFLEVRTFGRDPLILEKRKDDQHIFAVPVEWLNSPEQQNSSKVATVLMLSEGVELHETRYLDNIGFCLSNITVMNSCACAQAAV